MSVSKSGTVKMVAPNFAFVTASDNSGDCFVPRSVIEDAGLVLAKGDNVVYSAVPTPRGQRAVTVALAD